MSFANLHRLLEAVDAHAERVGAAHAGAMACRLGCTGCCRQDLAVSQVEAHHILTWLVERGLPPHDPAPTEHDAHPLFDMLSGGTACVFLGPGGGCGIYPVRPLICRTHGLPIKAPEGQRDTCPLNFADEGALDAVPGADVLDLDGLNQRFALVELLFCREEALEPARIPLSVLRQHAVELISEDPPQG